jgi:Tol biopolymer transport system component
MKKNNELGSSVFSRLAFIVILTVFGSTSVGYSQEPDRKVIFGSMDWAPDGQSFLFSSMIVKKDYSDYGPEKWWLYVYRFADQTIEQFDKGVPNISIHPDGKRLVYCKLVHGNMDIYVRELDDGEAIRLTDNPSRDIAPSWSPDGSMIVFNSDREDHYEIFVMNNDGSGLRQITHSDSAQSYSPQWAPDNDQIVYYLEKGDHMDQIYLTDARGSFHRNVTQDDHHNFYPTWTSDGQILFTTNNRDFCIINRDGSRRQYLENVHGMYAKQSPVSHEIVIMNPDRSTVALFNYDDYATQTLVNSKDFFDAAQSDD